jgi:hypothetical protein
MDEGRPAEALLAYDEAWTLSPAPALLYNRARASEKLEQYAQALALMERFAREADPALKAKVPRLDELLVAYRAKTCRLFVEVPSEGVEVRLGDRILGTSPLAQPMVVNAQPRGTLSVVSERYFPLERSLALPGGGDVHVELPLAARASTAVLRVSSPEVGALAEVDGNGSGNVPFDAVVVPGSHQVRLSKGGFISAATSVLVKAGELRLIELGLQPELKVYERWWFWAAIGAVVAGGVAAAVAWSIEGPVPKGTLNVGQPPIAPSFFPRF